MYTCFSLSSIPFRSEASTLLSVRVETRLLWSSLVYPFRFHLLHLRLLMRAHRCFNSFLTSRKSTPITFSFNDSRNFTSLFDPLKWQREVSVVIWLSVLGLKRRTVKSIAERDGQDPCSGLRVRRKVIWRLSDGPDVTHRTRLHPRGARIRLIPCPIAALLLPPPHRFFQSFFK